MHTSTTDEARAVSTWVGVTDTMKRDPLEVKGAISACRERGQGESIHQLPKMLLHSLIHKADQEG